MYKIEVEYETKRLKAKTIFIGLIKDIEKVIKEECKILNEEEFKIKKIKAKKINNKKNIKRILK